MTTHVMASNSAGTAGNGRPDTWSLFDRIKTIAIKLDGWWLWHQRYQRTARELGALSDHELNDIGIAHHDIPRIAFEAANRARS
ncbi:MAG: DUF1127 domain-containing protein [Alphaproteobacteria bacterium]|nr:DUF1127 domain-containing protein [Alphaproteobacteria bacterium]